VDAIAYRPIGRIHSPFPSRENMPIQPTGALGTPGTVRVFEEYEEGLSDLEGFSHLFLVYHFHLTRETRLRVVPFLDKVPRGVFATRSPNHPNPIGLSVVRLLGIDGRTLHIEDVDVVDSTPLLDIKPYVPAFDQRDSVRTGWMQSALARVESQRSDGRFR
jgi:tRNA-Thr(GGU) m(6)t(6)A37 methyltransferase TsaA